MNILIVDQLAGMEGGLAGAAAWIPSGPAAGAFAERHFALCREWAAAGCRAAIVTARPTQSEDISKTTVNGVELITLRAPCPRSGEHMSLREALGFGRELRRHASELAAAFAPHAVIEGSAAPFDVSGALRVARASGAALIWEMAEIQPEAFVASEHAAKNGPLALLLRRDAARAALHADRVASPLVSADKWLAERDAEQKLVFIPEAVSDHLGRPFGDGEAPISEIKQLRQDGRFTVVYAGELYRSPPLEDFIRAAGELGNKFAAVIIGSGGHKVILKRLAKELGAGNALFFDALSPAAGAAAMAAGDCAFVFDPPGSASEYGASLRPLLGGMLTGRPVIYVSASPSPILAKTGCGAAVSPGDAHAIAQAAVKLAALTEGEREDAGRQGREYALERHTYGKQAERWQKLLADITGRDK